MTSIELITLPAIRESLQRILPERLKSTVRHQEQQEQANQQSNEDTPPIQQTKQQKLRARAQLLVLCLCNSAVGFNDASAGPLLPRMQSAYQVSFSVVSLIFICTCIGYISGACLNVYLSSRLAFGKILVLSCVLQMIAAALEAPAPPFPVFVVGYFLNGFGSSMQLSQVNGYLAIMGGNVNAKVGISQAAYGAGAFCAPLIATQFSTMRHWSFHYLVVLGIVTLNTVFSSAIFRLRSRDECRADLGLEPLESNASEHSPFKHIFSLRAVHILAFFLFLYVGTEVTIGGWIVTYIIQLRGAGAQSGYISSGFWGGIMIGRIILIPMNEWLGDRLAIVVYTTLAIGLEIVVWLVPSLIGNGVAISLVGLFFGPMYPIALSTARRVIPRWIYTGAIGWISSFGGQAGSAALPFVTGAVADAVGIKSLQPLLVSMMGAMGLVWLIVPRPTRPD